MFGSTLIAFFVTLAAGAPREVTTMRAVDEVVDASTLVIFDIDNTLMQPKTELGSDQWFFFLIDRFMQQGMDKAQAMRRANEVWNATQWLIEMEPVEPETPELVRRLQARKIPIMALTARDRHSAAVTLAQLAQIGVRLADSAPARGPRSFPAKDLGGGEDGELVDGVLFVGETNEKGPSLVAFLKALSLAPKKVVFIDDKKKHTLTVTAALEGHGVPVVALRYGAADARVQRFEAVMKAASDPDMARLFLTGELSKSLARRVESQGAARAKSR